MLADAKREDIDVSERWKWKKDELVSWGQETECGTAPANNSNEEHLNGPPFEDAFLTTKRTTRERKTRRCFSYPKQTAVAKTY